MADEATITLSAPVAQYLLALVLNGDIRSENMDAYAKPLLAEALFPGNGEFVFEHDAPQLAREAFSATIWKDAAS
jgi:hypothetical protein